MNTINNKWMLCCTIMIMITACKKRYEPKSSVYDTNYLVVEGTINSGQGPTTIRLTRTSRPDSNKTKNETRATVRVEDQHNNRFPLTDSGNGYYTISQLNLNDNEKYRLYIRTSAGSEYVSEFLQPLRTAPIDSVSWARDEGVRIFVSTHDLQRQSVHYRWAWEETWEFHSKFTSGLEFTFNAQGRVTGLKDRSTASAEKIYRCWQSERSVSILQGTSEQLSRDTVHLALAHVPVDSWKISVLYSINVKQYAITPKEYEFWRRMKKNTEQIGTIFDEQPSILNTNIHCLSNRDEVVIGFVGVSDEQQKRLFIRNSEVPFWYYRQNCLDSFPVTLDLATLNYYRTDIPLYYQYDRSGAIIGVFIGERVCADCTSRGYNEKPSFWP